MITRKAAGENGPDFALSATASDRARLLLTAAGVLAFLVLFWSQTLDVPFWQDDYFFLLDAKRARLAGEPWYAPFLPEEKVPWWRPLGEKTYWRFVEGVLGGNAQAAHVTNIFLLVAGAAAVGWLVAKIAVLRAPKGDSAAAGLAAAALYGVHSSHFLPAAWASAANVSLSVLFASLTFRFWLIVTSARGPRALLAATAALASFVLALLTRDIAFVFPALGLLLALWLRPPCRASGLAWGTGALSVGVAFLWLVLRNRFTLPADSAYDLQFGLNVVRNATALVLFVFNVPFESLRFFFFVRPSFGIAAWAGGCFLLQAGAFGLLLRAAREELTRRDLFHLGAFFIVGCAPYFLLGVNCYPYYTTVGLFGYAAVAGFAALRKRPSPWILLLAALSSGIATLGNSFLDSPSHIGRARWAERQLVRLEAMRDAQPALFAPPLVVLVEDEHRFLGFRAEGIAYRLGIDLRSIDVRYPGQRDHDGRPVLVVPATGDVSFRTEGPRSRHDGMDGG